MLKILIITLLYCSYVFGNVGIELPQPIGTTKQVDVAILSCDNELVVTSVCVMERNKPTQCVTTNKLAKRKVTNDTKDVVLNVFKEAKHNWYTLGSYCTLATNQMIQPYTVKEVSKYNPAWTGIIADAVWVDYTIEQKQH